MDTTEIGFLRRDGDGFFPLDMGISKWSPDMINGPAITGILARAIENEHGAEGFVPARLTVDLFRPARPSNSTSSPAASATATVSASPTPR